MPLFFFHLRTPEGLEPDQDGLVMADLETAYLQACAAIPDMAAEFMQTGQNPLPYGFVIADAVGETLMEVPFAERMRSSRPPVRSKQHDRARRLSSEIAEAINAARETLRHSREILARARRDS